MRIALLADFGSTFTKVVAVDIDRAAIVGQAQEPTSLTGEILDGYETAVNAALAGIREPTTVVAELAASSAGGGLRMMAVGLTAGFTSSAAKAAALNAGARVVGVLTGRLTARDVAEVISMDPEIVLFAGGTDGGQESLVLQNASCLAAAAHRAHVVVACNEAVASEVSAIFEPSARSVTVAPNVLPHVGLTSHDEAREAISRLFIGEVIAGKGLSRSGKFTRLVQMATPDAVLRAAAIYARTSDDATGDGVVFVDVGGATTDVYSVVTTKQIRPLGTVTKGFDAPAVMRTVQGDLGLRSNASGVVQADGQWLESQSGGADWLVDACDRRGLRPASLFLAGRERALDENLAVSCLTRSLERHCGCRSIRRSATGATELVLQGANLTGCRTLVAGGGLLRTKSGEQIVRRALARLPEAALAPQCCRIVVDRHGVLAAAGLLAQDHPELARDLLRTELR